MHPSGDIRPRCESESTWAHDGNAPNPPVAKDCLAGSSRLLTTYGRRYLANDNGRRARKPTALFSGQKQNDVTASQSPKLSPIVLASFLVKPSWVILRRWNRSSRGDTRSSCRRHDGIPK